MRPKDLTKEKPDVIGRDSDHRIYYNGRIQADKAADLVQTLRHKFHS